MTRVSVSFTPTEVARAVIRKHNNVFKVRDIIDGALVAWDKMTDLDRCVSIAEANTSPAVETVETASPAGG